MGPGAGFPKKPHFIGVDAHDDRRLIFVDVMLIYSAATARYGNLTI